MSPKTIISIFQAQPVLVGFMWSDPTDNNSSEGKIIFLKSKKNDKEKREQVKKKLRVRESP